jgi:hypothetical protein
MSSKLLLAGALVSTVTCFAHTNLGFKMAPALRSLALPASHAGQNGWYQVSGYFLLNGTKSIDAVLMIAIQQARWARYGIVNTYDEVYFWGLNLLYTCAGLGYARAGIVEPQVAFFANVALMVASRMFM